jgi:methyl-accepting chemotaxis protein
MPARVAGRLEDAGRLLDAVIATRDRVEALRTIPVEIIENYSRMNGELLRIVDDVAAMVAEQEHRPAVLAWTALLYAKEKTGIERAQLVSAFERDRYFDGQYQSVLGLIAARQSYLHLFAIAAPPPIGKMTRERLVGEVAEDVERMERIALVHRDGGFGVDPLAWFAAMTRQMDLLSEAEAKVRATLSR